MNHNRNRKPDDLDAAHGASEPEAPPAGKKSLTALLPPPVLPQDSARYANHAGLAGRGPDGPNETSAVTAPAVAADDPFALHLPADPRLVPRPKAPVQSGPTESEVVDEED